MVSTPDPKRRPRPSAPARRRRRRTGRRSPLPSPDEHHTWRRGLFGTNPTPVRTHGPAHERHWTSRLLHHVGAATAHSGAGTAAAIALAVWVAVGWTTGFPDWWETVLYSTTSGLTLVMVFVIQHTQARQTSATQRKLDELIRSSSAADSTYIAAEEAPDGELELLAEISESERQGVCGQPGPKPAPER